MSVCVFSCVCVSQVLNVSLPSLSVIRTVVLSSAFRDDVLNRLTMNCSVDSAILSSKVLKVAHISCGLAVNVSNLEASSKSLTRKRKDPLIQFHHIFTVQRLFFTTNVLGYKNSIQRIDCYAQWLCVTSHPI